MTPAGDSPQPLGTGARQRIAVGGGETVEIALLLHKLEQWRAQDVLMPAKAAPDLALGDPSNDDAAHPSTPRIQP
jgi:hypothetical protein